MISIIICSRTQTISPQLSQNIEETIGSAYELIVIDNTANQHSIFEAYNLGIQKSKGDYWCFLHDDVLFHSKNWGKTAVAIFEKDAAIGLLGVAGAKVKTKMPSTWWDCPESQRVINIIQHLDANTIEKWEVGWKNESYEEVSVIDGVFMLGRKDTAITFDERLKGFHNYDLNLSLAYKKANYKIMVAKEILFEHFSLGTINKDWYLSTLKFDRLYNNLLPLQVAPTILESEFKVLEFKNGMIFCAKLVHYKLKREALRYWLALILIKPIAKFHFRFLQLIVK